MKTGFLFAVLVSTAFASMGHAAPSCRQVLKSSSSTISDEAITEGISQIARLKLNLDEAQIEGKSIAHQFLSTQYPLKFQEMVQHLQGRLSENEISELIKKEIRVLQKNETSTDREKTKQLRKEKKLLETPRPFPYTYKRIKEYLDSTFMGPSNTSEQIYIPKEKRFYYFDRTDFVSVSIYRNDPIRIAEDAKAGALMKDRDTMLLFKQFSDEFRLLKYSFAKGKLKIATKIKVADSLSLPKDIQDMFLNPSNSLALLQGYEKGHRYSVVDIKTGVEVLNQNELPEKLASAIFIDDNHLAVLEQNKKLSVIDLTTKKIVQKTFLNSIAYDQGSSDKMPKMIVSNDGKILMVAHKYSFISLDAKHIRSEINEVEIPYVFDGFIKTPDYPQAVFVAGNDNTVKLVNMNTLAVEFTFHPQNNEWKIDSLAISPDGTEIITNNVVDFQERLSVRYIREDN